MSTLFTKMLDGEVRSHRLAETERSVAILEPSPLAEGHALVFPRKPIDWIYDLDDADLKDLLLLSKRVAHALRRTVPCDKVALAAYGLKVRHAHLHLVPVSGRAGELDLTRTRPEADDDALAVLAERVRSAL
ncbi:MAG: putative HIT-like protein [Candidatus Omnitrophica bacterium]|nr:putative HIT-like protein [Candidatus Omnitrophota bacterium]